MFPRFPFRFSAGTLVVALAACAGAPGGEDSARSASQVGASGNATMHVRVLHADGSPVPWAWIEIDDAREAKRFAGNAPQGEFAALLPPASYGVKAWDGSRYLGTTGVDLRSELTVDVGEVPSHCLRTEAVHADGSPVAWAWVDVDDSRGASVFQGNSPNGVNDMILLRGRYHLRAFDGSRLFLQTDVDLSADEVITLSEGAPVPPAPPPTKGFVQASGTGLVLDGQAWHFKGLDIYNANSRNNCWTDLADGTALDDSLSQIGAGQNAFRAWFFQKLAIVNGVRDWTAFDHTLAAAKARGQKVIATLENQWQDCDDASFYKTESWYQAGYEERQGGDLDAYRDWVQEVVSRYAGDPTILAWQLMNEAEDAPAGGESGGTGCSSTAASSLQAFARDVSALIKHLDPNHLVNIGTLAGGQCGTGGAGEWKALHAIATIDLCEYHDYTGAAGITPALQARIDECHAAGKPIFAGEVGLDASASRASQADGKLRAQLGAGDVGVLFWAWDYGDPSPTGFDIGAGDPLLQVLTRY